jgi:hypothetical protein
MEEPTLVERAIELQKKKQKYNEQDMDLAVAFLRNEISMKTLLDTKKLTQYVTGMVFIAATLKQGIRSGHLALEKRN